MTQGGIEGSEHRSELRARREDSRQLEVGRTPYEDTTSGRHSEAQHRPGHLIRLTIQLAEGKPVPLEIHGRSVRDSASGIAEHVPDQQIRRTHRAPTPILVCGLGDHTVMPIGSIRNGSAT